jgi:sugar phosphate isomerase/epimerase
MKIGFLTAALPHLSLEELVEWGSAHGFHTLEVACWPSEFEKRKYAGAQHIDVTALDEGKAAQIKDLLRQRGMGISALAYYPNYLDPDPQARGVAIEHLKKVLHAAHLLGVTVVATFVGRDPRKNVEETLNEYKNIFDPLVSLAEDNGVRIAIENCPMLFEDRWPGGSNIAYSPEIWERMFELIPSDFIGLNLDPSHLIWLQIDYVQAIYDYRDKIFHTHAKDTKVDQNKLARTGVLGFGWHEDKVAGTGEVDWKRYFRALYDVGYDFVVSIEHEDRSFDQDESRIKRGICLAKKLLSVYLE